MSKAPRWYVVPDDPTREQYFNGSMWIGARRPRQDETPLFPDGKSTVSEGVRAPDPLARPTQASPPTAQPRPTSARTSDQMMDGLGIVGVIIYILAGLTAVGAVIAGVTLIVHRGQSCSPNPYSDALDTDLEDCSTTHPFKGAGWGVLAGGLVQSFVLLVVAYLCVTVDRMRREAAA